MSDTRTDEATKTYTAVRGKRFESVALLRDGEETGWVCLQESDMAFIETEEADCYESLKMWRSRSQEQAERIAELERREALLTAFVARSDRLVEFEVAHPEDLWPADVLEELSELQGSFFAGRAAIDWIPRP